MIWDSGMKLQPLDSREFDRENTISVLIILKVVSYFARILFLCELKKRLDIGKYSRCVWTGG